MVKRIVGFTIILLCAVSGSFAKNTCVKGYFRKDGTYVSPHYRSAPDSKFYNNWSTSGNINPYTGKEKASVSLAALSAAVVSEKQFVGAC
jgi:hypothetical protein